MNRILRIGLALALLLATGAALLSLRYWQVRAVEEPPPEAVRNVALTNQDCQQCHPQVWQEWEASGHAQAFTSDAVQAAFRHFGHDRKCESCHAPQPVLLTGITEPVELRKADRASGVNCLSCHALPGGDVAAARTVADAPCRPRHSTELLSSQACGSCHTAIYEDWVGSRYQQQGQTCQACHMPAIAGEVTRRNHECIGGHNADYIRSGVKMEARESDGHINVSVTNHATGHNFPGERHNRVLLLHITQRNAAGRITSNREQTIKDITPFRGESSAERIRIDESYQTSVPVVEATTAVEIRLLYKAFPWYPIGQAIVLHKIEIELTP